MKLIITYGETRVAVAEWLNKQKIFGIIKPEQINPNSHIEGQHEDSCEVLDGFEVEIPIKE